MKRLIWRETAEVIAVLGVIGSLVFVALEIRQNTNAVRSATIQAISEQSFDSNMRVAEHPDLATLFLRSENEEPLTESERFRLNAFWTALLRINQNRFQQLRLGVLNDATIFEVGGTNSIFRSRSFTEYWEARRQRESDEFRQLIEECVISVCESVPESGGR